MRWAACFRAVSQVGRTWFDKARLAIEQGGLEAAGLVSTQSIRAGSNRVVLTAICESSRIFDAWSDEAWVNEGAAVRVSLVCFGVGERHSEVNGKAVEKINADLKPGGIYSNDLTQSELLKDNRNAIFLGTKKSGGFDIEGSLARQWLGLPNPHQQPNADVLRPWANGQELVGRPLDKWIIDFGIDKDMDSACLFEVPFNFVVQHIKPERENNNRAVRAKYWWRLAETMPAMRRATEHIGRFIATPRVAKYRIFVWRPAIFLPDDRLAIIARADDSTFGILSSRIHELWSLAQASMHGVGNDPTYNAKSCFETFPFPAGLTPADTAHQRVEALPGGATIPADIYKENMPLVLIHQRQVAIKTILTSAIEAKPSSTSKARVVRRSGAILKSNAYEPPASEPAAPGESPQTVAHHNASPSTSKSSTQVTAPAPRDLREHATAIAQAAKKLNDLREAWLNPPEWTHRVPEVIPLGLDHSPYPDRIEPRPGISEADLKALQKRTLTNLYNAKPAWLTLAHQHLDAAVAAAYGWADYSPALPDDEILKRLLALNLARST